MRVFAIDARHLVHTGFYSIECVQDDVRNIA